MSTPIAQYKLPSRIEIGFDSEAKASIADLKVKLDEANKSLSARDSGLLLESKRKCNSRIGQIVADATSNQIKEILRPEGLLKEMSPPDGLLKAMQAEAANDSNGVTPIHYEAQLHGGWVRHFDVDLLKPTINRETVNDVDYLSGSDLDESVPTIQDMEAGYTILDETRNYWQAESVPQITQADMQLIFIKNLSECLIQRMHSMNRFSEDDYAIGGDKLMAWDCLIEAETGRFALVSGIGFENRTAIINTFNQDFNDELFAAAYTLDLSFLKKTSLRTITEDELPAFRAALEACYA